MQSVDKVMWHDLRVGAGFHAAVRMTSQCRWNIRRDTLVGWTLPMSVLDETKVRQWTR
jgi:hypothetical protein